MSLIELLLISVGLSMDAFAVAVCKGLSIRKLKFKNALTVGLYFGIFQAGMPLIGYFLGLQFQDIITSVDHWITFILLGFIGINMINESRQTKSEIASGSEAKCGETLEFKNMIGLAVATSIDALAVGITLAFLKVNIIPAILFTGITTFILSMLGVKIGNVFGAVYKSKAEFTGGIILIIIGLKILLEHTNVI